MPATIVRDFFLANATPIPYWSSVPLHPDRYAGWLGTMQFLLNGNPVAIDTKTAAGRFYLYVLAVAWSRPGQWENAAYLMTVLAGSGKSPSTATPPQLEDETSIAHRQIARVTLVNGLARVVPRKTVSFRDDIPASIRVLGSEWVGLENAFTTATQSHNWRPYVDKVAAIPGLGNQNNGMKIKIPLILRELRCAGGATNPLGIPGELCCVPDARVRKNTQTINGILAAVRPGAGIVMHVPHPYPKVDQLVASSTAIYHQFQDAYDIPLFGISDIPDWEQRLATEFNRQLPP